jgi:hypothetical protein
MSSVLSRFRHVAAAAFNRLKPSGIGRARHAARARHFGSNWRGAAPGQGPPTPPPPNPLWEYFQANKVGPGVWKWTQYFEAYHRHLARFIGRDVHVVEVGVYSGGSLPMWKSYFGPRCQVTGVDIEPACKAYQGDGTRIVIGDQGSRDFWRAFRSQSPPADVLIDDGGHHPEQQAVTLEEVLPHLRPGGVYLCEDVHGTGNAFAAYAHSLADQLNASNWLPKRPGQAEIVVRATPLQAAVHSVHLYPYLIAIELRESPIGTLEAPKHGTEWQPFL